MKAQVARARDRVRRTACLVFVGFQWFITHWAVGECFVPAEQIRVCDSGDGRADKQCQPEHPQRVRRWRRRTPLPSRSSWCASETQRLLPRWSGSSIIQISTECGVLSRVLREVEGRSGAAPIALEQSHLLCEVVGGGDAARIALEQGPVSSRGVGRYTVAQPVAEVPLPGAGRPKPADPRCGSPRPIRPAGSAFGSA